MINLFITNLRSLHMTAKPLLKSCIPLSCLHTRSLLPHKDKPTTWNTTHTFVLSNPILSLLEKCSSMDHLKQIQAQMVVTGLISDGLAASRLIAFCAISEHGNLDHCKELLNNIENPNGFSWNVAMRGYSESESPKEALLLYKQMLKNNWPRPDNYTYPLLLKTCACLSLISVGSGILGHVYKWGFDSDAFVFNAMVHMLVSCGEFKIARKVFDVSPVRNLVSWNSLINGYVRRGRAHEALDVYREMKMGNFRPDGVTLIGVVSACGQLEDLKLGKELHRYIEENGLNLNVPLANALMDMYVKCGELKLLQIMDTVVQDDGEKLWNCHGNSLHGVSLAVVTFVMIFDALLQNWDDGRSSRFIRHHDLNGMNPDSFTHSLSLSRHMDVFHCEEQKDPERLTA
ncbi:hypothetical protein RJ639_008872 [Escallonia herrerae]|uniref:Pentatricopeptide repeat-containing protein n=1 Tax=Escallonia herrerae TaxID=1293975 RepID=A0AA88VRZ7_9ASTE|nr:hypothetical protein RJ639_008872 [Escallonia herrerae]